MLGTETLQQHHDTGWPCCLSVGTHYFNNCSLRKNSGFGLFKNNNKKEEKSWAVLSSVPPALLTLHSLGLMTHFSSIQNQCHRARHGLSNNVPECVCGEHSVAVLLIQQSMKTPPAARLAHREGGWALLSVCSPGSHVRLGEVVC